MKRICSIVLFMFSIAQIQAQDFEEKKYEPFDKDLSITFIDYKRRQLILDYIERFQTAFNVKDKDSFTSIFREDALYIEANKKTLDPIMVSNKDFINRKKKILKKSKFFQMSIDGISVTSKADPHFYGISIHIAYQVDYKSLGAYMFMLWDFTNENAPQIQVYTWQPDRIGGKPLPKDEVFSLSDFDI